MKIFTQFKNGKKSNRHFSKDDIHMAKMPMKKNFNITYSQENANLNYSEISLHIVKMTNIKKEKNKTKK